jgi:hypothetical protein
MASTTQFIHRITDKFTGQSWSLRDLQKTLPDLNIENDEKVFNHECMQPQIGSELV